MAAGSVACHPSATHRSRVLAGHVLAGPVGGACTAVAGRPSAVGTSGEQTPSERLFAAAKTGDAAACREALSAGADPNWRDEDFFGYTPLHMAAAGGHIEVCQLLRQAGASVDPRSESDETPLIMAARAQKSLAVCEFLLAEGADATAKTNYKRNARSAREYLDDMYKELGAPPRCGLGSS
mmetsp:Transcript_96270/g.281185  ORF Transcript_96270/g.281185 Transcript_96270/m.281185 type:complete len:181 (-) Transcript_96270:112-654(-)